ncbi:helix-turn-helix transcriptional regulator [Rathayibacter sp. VKM Ac-2801]|uniref:helix-turn-helix domain-containing protein n=1 Tax=Rathayibacter sp. VKM Ac-2801 TaxID=2609255 RepID=UPI0013201761|nr:helix-turn-helix transcriptional regulator [Rathayibacter sp. VKM Ac-2801]QHC71740.1 helix-turn-helix domain-containing protein [Rathayibacter sp. VKM Ac-2801]
MSSDARQLAEFLRARRAQLRPEDVGYPPDPNRRVHGLRRAEVADLAGISLDYYVRLEQGRAYQMSEQVLAGLTRALSLKDDAAAYFYRLALPAPPHTAVRSAPSVSDLVRHLVERWSDLPVYVVDANQDVLISNALAEALIPSVGVPGYNTVQSTFLAPAEGRGLASWQNVARICVAALRYHANPHDPRLQEIVGDLSVRDADFRRMWAQHEAFPFSDGTAPVFVDGFGFGEFPWQTLAVPGGLLMLVWLAPPGTFAADAIDFLRKKLHADPDSISTRPQKIVRRTWDEQQQAIQHYMVRANQATLAAIEQEAG